MNANTPTEFGKDVGDARLEGTAQLRLSATPGVSSVSPPLNQNNTVLLAACLLACFSAS